jgi:hypothetical protein
MMRAFVWITVVVGALVVFSGEAHARYRGFAEEAFFGRHVGAAGAGAGGSGVTSSGEIIKAFYNPAGLADARGLGFCASWADPDNGLEDGENRYVGGSLRIGEYGTIGLSRYKVAYGNDTRRRPQGSYRIVSGKASIVVLTIAEEPVKDLLVGVNVSAFEYKPAADMGRSVDEARSFWADAGLIKYFEMARTQASAHWLKLGGSLSNFTYSDIHVGGTYDELPVALRLGAAYEMGWWGLTWEQGLRTVETVAQVEYQNILNYDYRTALRFGGELRLLEILALRLGYESESVDDYAQAENRDRLGSTTYGFGISLPLQKIGGGKVPLRVGLDYARTKRPAYTRDQESEDFKTTTICASYYF